jgi:hypothetical protein
MECIPSDEVSLLLPPEVLVLKVSLRCHPVELIEVKGGAGDSCNVTKHLAELKTRVEVEDVCAYLEPNILLSVEKDFFQT